MIITSLKTFNIEGAVAFRQNQTKNIGGIDFSVPPFIFFRVFNKMMLNFSEILRFDYIFCFILVSSLSVPLYASRSSAKDFLSKSVRPGSVRIKNSLKLYSNRNFYVFALICLNS